jgi:hypothetical protein
MNEKANPARCAMRELLQLNRFSNLNGHTIEGNDLRRRYGSTSLMRRSPSRYQRLHLQTVAAPVADTLAATTVHTL